MFLLLTLFFSLSFLHVSGCDPNCSDKPVFTPSRLVVKHGDAASATCSVCQSGCHNNTFGLETSIGEHTTTGTMISWKIDRLTEWGTELMCYYTDDVNDRQCCSILTVIVYKPPDSVSISFGKNTEPMVEDHQYTLLCEVHNVAPVKNVKVTFYRGNTSLGQPQFINNTHSKPVTEIYNLTITPSKENNGAQYWCEAKLELGAEGPQDPPVVKSQHITSTVYYKPHLQGASPSQINITEGESLQLNCSAVGNPRPSYNWRSPVSHVWNSSILTINSVTSADKGRYTCSINNSVGAITVTFDVFLQGSNCTNKPVFNSSRLVVKHGDAASATCSVCQSACHNNTFGLESSIGEHTTTGTMISWKIDRMTEWGTELVCYYNDDYHHRQCRSTLPVIVYKPPEIVSIIFENHVGLMYEGRQYTLLCTVHNVAPVKNVKVTFYRGKTSLGQPQFINNAHSEPVTEIYNLTFTPSKEDDGAQYWCETKLELGPEGPQLPPVVKSQHITASIYSLTSTPTTLPPTTTTTTTVPNRSTSSSLIHIFIMCFMLLFPVLV